jgi:hypothetical protein
MAKGRPQGRKWPYDFETLPIQGRCCEKKKENHLANINDRLTCQGILRGVYLFLTIAQGKNPSLSGAR